MNYHLLREYADSYGLIFMGVVFVVFVAWTFRRNAGAEHRRAATSIFEKEDRADG